MWGRGLLPARKLLQAHLWKDCVDTLCSAWGEKRPPSHVSQVALAPTTRAAASKSRAAMVCWSVGKEGREEKGSGLRRGTRKKWAATQG